MSRRILVYEAIDLLWSFGLSPAGPYQGPMEPWECFCWDCGSQKIHRVSILKNKGYFSCGDCKNLKSADDFSQRGEVVGVLDIASAESDVETFDVSVGQLLSSDLTRHDEEFEDLDGQDIQTTRISDFQSLRVSLSSDESVRAISWITEWFESCVERLRYEAIARWFAHDVKVVCQTYRKFGVTPSRANFERTLMNMARSGEFSGPVTSSADVYPHLST